MTAIIDKRNTGYDGRVGLESADAGGAQKVNQYTGHRTEVIATGDEAFATAGGGSDAELIARAKEFAGSITESVGFAPGEPVEFEADPTVMRTSGGQRVVSLQQTLNGIEVWGMAPKVWLDDAGDRRPASRRHRQRPGRFDVASGRFGRRRTAGCRRRGGEVADSCDRVR